MEDLVLTFGKHRGKKLSQVEPTYLEWLSKSAYSDKVRKAAGEFWRTSLTDQEREYERELEQFVYDNPVRMVSWEAGGHRIEVRAVLDERWYQMKLQVSIDGDIVSSHLPEEIKPCSVPGRPEIVARLGKAGLTEDRRQAILKLLED